jgi:hypothetical protein
LSRGLETFFQPPAVRASLQIAWALVLCAVVDLALTTPPEDKTLPKYDRHTEANKGLIEVVHVYSMFVPNPFKRKLESVSARV